jgi:hypothetical protein
MSVGTETLAANRTDWRIRLRVLCAGVAAIVVLDAAIVRAPFLTFLAVPFVVAAVGIRKAHLATLLAVLAWSALYVVLAVNYAIGSGFDAPWSDLVFAYAGAPLAAAIAWTAASRLPRSRR